MCRAVTQKPRIRRWVGMWGFISPSVSTGKAQLWGWGAAQIHSQGSAHTSLVPKLPEPEQPARRVCSSGIGAAASSSEAASGLAGKVEAVPPRCPSFPQPAPALPSQETLFAGPICSLGTAWCSRIYEDDEGAAKIETPLSNSALALWAGDGNKDCPWGCRV